MKRIVIIFTALLFIPLSGETANAQDFSEAQNWAVEAFADKHSEYIKDNSQAGKASKGSKGADSDIQAKLNVGALPLGINQDQAAVKYKLKSYSGEGPLMGVHLPDRLFRVPYNGRN